MYPSTPATTQRAIWNKDKLVGRKPPLKLKEARSIRTRLQLADRVRDLALLKFAIDSELRACDLVRLRVVDISQGGHVAHRIMVLQNRRTPPCRPAISTAANPARHDTHPARLPGHGSVGPGAGQPVPRGIHARRLRHHTGVTEHPEILVLPGMCGERQHPN